ncbi:MAG: NUDIX hydrolase [Tannerellaceae bacterium]
MIHNNEELFPLVDEAGNVTGSATRQTCQNGCKLLHPVVHLHVFNEAGELFLQKRPMHKDIQPGKWDTAVGGHVDFGETPDAALVRESREELGIVGFTPIFVARYVFESEIEKELVYIYKTVYTETISPDAEELDGGRFWSIKEIDTMIGKEVFTPNFEKEFTRFRTALLD